MKLLIKTFGVIISIAFFNNCNTTEPPIIPPPDDTVANTITLTVEWTDLYRINVKWNKSLQDTLVPFTYLLTQTDEQGNKTTKQFTITGKDTNYTAGEPDSLQQGKTYKYFVEAFNKESKLKDTSKTAVGKTLTPTSHDIIWQIDTLGQAGNFLRDVWGLDENNVWAVGYVDLPVGSSGITKWDGTAWTPFPTFEGVKQGIFGCDENNIFVVGEFGAYGVVGRWDGSKWNVNNFFYEILGQDTVWALRSVWGSAPDDVWAVGDNGTIIHWDGFEWTKIKGIIGTNNSFWDVWGTDSNNIYTVTASLTNNSQLWHYDGILWSNISDEIPGNRKNLYSIWLDKSKFGFIGGNTVLRIEGGFIEDAGITVSRVLTKVRGKGATDVIFGGQRGTVYHYNGIEFSEYPELRSYQGVLNEILGVQVFENKIFLVGYSEKALVYIGSR